MHVIIYYSWSDRDCLSLALTTAQCLCLRLGSGSCYSMRLHLHRKSKVP
uniref:Uncharacterized protein n=1 Tax=Anguilla anguilla TaxID=7936 RepID=A0A0E9XBN9_ANGAN